METKQQNKFMKEFISRETKEAFTDLKHILETSSDSDPNSSNCKTAKSLINLYLEQSKSADKSGKIKTIDQLKVSKCDINHIIKCIFKYKLDFSNRCSGKRNILEVWQKTRAFKNEEDSIKLRESGNDYLRIGQLNKALALYNEALLYGWNDYIKMTKNDFE